ncbi:MAG: molybdopterin biosynthesis protein, partial [Gammaproteobacteria bacterium]|nr:molybdopterin biosynthesis protein [Gammaproteobacteria bacterium]
MKRQVYLSMKPLQEAKELFFSRFGRDKRTDMETISIEDALGRIIVEPLFAKRSCPSFHSAAMDGIAVRAEETYGTTEKYPRTLKVGRDAVWINTG